MRRLIQSLLPLHHRRRGRSARRSKLLRPRCEPLESRALLAVTASFSAASGLLSVVGDAEDNVISIAWADDGRVLVNNGEVDISGDTPNANNFHAISALGMDGNDEIVLDESNGALPNATLDGGRGNDLLMAGDGADVLRGGAGNDVLLGNRGNDRVEGQDGSDLLIWNDGDGSDFLEGGEGFDFVQVNGANGAGDDFSIDPNGDRVRFQRNNLDRFTLSIGTTETLDVNGQGGNDVIVGSTGLVGLIGLDLDGGEGNDLLIGGDGADVLRGGAGDDDIIGGWGNDWISGGTGRDRGDGGDGDDTLVWNDGDGDDALEGGEGFDFVQVNGSNGAGDDFSIDPNGDRVRFQRNNLGLFTLDIGTTENLDVNGQGGDDVIVVSIGFGGEMALDLDGGDGDDTLRIGALGGFADVSGLSSDLVTGIERIDLAGSGASSLALDVQTVLGITDEANRLVVLRNASDTVDVGSGWTNAGAEANGQQWFDVYTQGDATLLVQRTNPLGDFNGDGEVNRADIVLLAKSYGRTHGVGPDDGDLDGDGIVGLRDLVAALRNHVGSRPTPAAADALFAISCGEQHETGTSAASARRADVVATPRRRRVEASQAAQPTPQVALTRPSLASIRASRSLAAK